MKGRLLLLALLVAVICTADAEVIINSLKTHLEFARWMGRWRDKQIDQSLKFLFHLAPLL